MTVALNPRAPAAEASRCESLTVEVVASREGFAALAPEWNALADLDPRGLPFLRHELFAVWLQRFAPEARLHVITVREGDELCAVVPLMWQRSGPGDLLAPALVSPTNPHSCRFDVLVRPGEAGRAALDRVWQHLLELDACHRVELRDVPTGDGHANRLLELAAAEGLAGTWESQDSPYVDLAAAGSLAAYEATLSSKLRANLRRRGRNLATRGAVSFERFPAEGAAPDEARLTACVSEILALEAAGWKGRAGTAIALGDAVRGFYHDLCRLAFARGWLRLYFLRLDGRAIACHLGLRYGRRYFLLKPAYDEGHADCSPGQLLMREVIADLYREGVAELDFLGPMMTWKRDWTALSRPHRWLYLFRPTWRARAFQRLKFVWRPRVKAALTSARERLDAWRRVAAQER